MNSSLIVECLLEGQPDPAKFIGNIFPRFEFTQPPGWRYFKVYAHVGDKKTYMGSLNITVKGRVYVANVTHELIGASLAELDMLEEKVFASKEHAAYFLHRFLKSKGLF